MRVALVCPTVGQTRRGYERFMTDLFHLLRADVDLTLFKGGGEPRENEVVVRHLTRTGVMSRVCGNRLKLARYRLEFATFAAALLPNLVRGRFDLVHFIDPPLAMPLAVFRKLKLARYGLLFTSAGPDPTHAAGWADHAHYLTPAARDEAIAADVVAEQLSLLPVGVDASIFSPADERAELRRRHGVPDGARVILAVTTLNRRHKRVDHLVEEVAKLRRRDVHLWIDGSLHPDGDPSLMDMARARLGERCRITHVPSNQVRDLYRLADVMVSASLNEPFGMSLVEAACCGTPVIAHNSPHFRWLLGEQATLADMRWPGVLASQLSQLLDDPDRFAHAAQVGRDVAKRFAGCQHPPHYHEM
jgi:glycosyltransferase involved in cell wall biosynthesis